jgi:hypothetical protein
VSFEVTRAACDRYIQEPTPQLVPCRTRRERNRPCICRSLGQYVLSTPFAARRHTAAPRNASQRISDMNAEKPDGKSALMADLDRRKKAEA